MREWMHGTGWMNVNYNDLLGPKKAEKRKEIVQTLN